MSEAVERSRSHLSIGEVLSLLQDEFPDITISKIRFLESQGLLDPERTPSGYRKFYDDDIGRLRWILQQQREHFLPLKVIKERLEGGELDEPVGEDAEAGVDAAASTPTTPSRSARRPTNSAELDLPTTPTADAAPAPAPAPASAGRAPAPTEPRAPIGVGELPPAAGAPSSDDPPDAHTAGRGAARAARDAVRTAPLDPGPASVALSREELADAADITVAQVADLERFGMLTGRTIGPSVLFDEAALGVARLCAGFLRYGVEGRHLRSYRVAAEREASFFQQVVMPMLKQRNPHARQQAVETLGELAELGEGLRAAMLHHALREYLGNG